MKRITTQFSLFLILLLGLTGCFQQAGEAYQPANTTVEPLTIPQDTPTLDLNLEATSTEVEFEDSNEPDVTDLEATSTLGIDITIISPTRALPATATPEEAIPFDVQPTEEGLIGATATPVFITPSSPLGQVTLATAAPDGPATATPSGLITPTSFLDTSTTANSECAYTIQSGDTLFRIATNRGTTVNAIVSANPGINPNLIQPGQVIQLPDCGTGAAAPAPTTDTAGSAPPPAGDGTTHTVQRGDTLFAIAQRYGVTVQAIVDANNLSNPNNLSPGQQLIIPPPAP